MPRKICLALTLALLTTAFEAAADESSQQLAALDAPAPADRAVMPADIDTLTLASDFAPFMRQDCPEDLRLKALRRLWPLLPRSAIDEQSAI